MSAVPPNPTVSPVTDVASMGTDLTQAATAAATIATAAATSNPVGLVIGSIEAFSALSGIIQNILAMQSNKPLTATQLSKLFEVLNEQTVSADLAWQKATGSAPIA